MRNWTVALLVAASFAAARHNAGIRRMDLEARHHEIVAEKRGLLDGLDPDPNNGSSGSQSSTISQGNEGGSSTSVSYGGPPLENHSTTSTSEQQQQQPPPTSTSSTVHDTPTSTSSTSTTPTTSTSSTQQTQNSVNVISRSTTDNYRGTTLYANSGNLSNLRASQTAVDSSETATATGASTPFLQNKTAVSATFTILGIVVAGCLVFIGFWFYRKSKRGAMVDEDTWDEASMKEYSHGAGAGAGAAISPPSAAMLADDGYGASGLGRKNTVLPSQSTAAGGLGRARSTNSPPRRDIDPEEEPDEILQLPPVTNYERPRDSAYDIVPAAPPPAAYVSQGGGYGYNAYASSSGGAAGGLKPPKRAGDHSSFGSGVGSDPFAGTGFVDATRESTYGPGQAGRGAGYHGEQDYQAPVAMGNQWPQGYNQAYGYSGGSQSPYGAGYGYAQ